MNPTEYVKNVLVTEARDFTPLQERFSKISTIRLLHGIIGLTSELSEIRQMANEPEIDEVNLKEEMGDLCWYMGIMVDELKINPELVLVTRPVEEREDYSNKKEALLTAIDKMTIFVGNTADILKKSLIYGKILQEYELIEQLSELNSEIEVALNLYGMNTSEARERNIEKLKARYGEKFSEAAALNRDLVKERKILE